MNSMISPLLFGWVLEVIFFKYILSKVQYRIFQKWSVYHRKRTQVCNSLFEILVIYGNGRMLAVPSIIRNVLKCFFYLFVINHSSHGTRHILNSTKKNISYLS